MILMNEEQEIAQYQRTMKRILKHPVRKGRCQSCGLHSTPLFRVADKRWCQSCVRRHFESKTGILT
jgi:hypothetical protein